MLLRRLALLALVLAVAAGAASGSRSASAQTPPARQRLPGHVLGILPRATRVASPANAGSQPLRLTVVLNRSDEAGFEAYLKDVQDPASPNFQHFLSQTDLAARFGPSQQAYDSTLKFLEAQGFSLVEGSANRLTLTVQGSRTRAEQAFALTIGDYQFGGRSFYANDTDPAVPAAVAPQI